MKKGFTLLEMMVTIVVLTIGIVTVLQMMSIAIFADNNAENSVVAFYLAQETMEEVKDASAYADIDGLASSRIDHIGQLNTKHNQILRLDPFKAFTKSIQIKLGHGLFDLCGHIAHCA